jgi:8-hydroxy-5-deazaflavin:NADPH oxidoreductase
MKIAIIGAGNVGKALAGRFAKAGHAVVFGVRDPAAAKNAALPHPALRVTEAAATADAVVLATSWAGTEAACRDMTLTGALAGKIVLDCTNPLAMGPAGRELAVAHTNSAGETVAGWCPHAHVYKAFNTVPTEVMVAPERMTVKPVVFVAGDDAAPKPAALKLVEDTGFEARDAGPMRNARMLEYLALLYLDLAMVRGMSRSFAFALSWPKA